jgi:L-lactate dehydrogenase complex protein LldG
MKTKNDHVQMMKEKATAVQAFVSEVKDLSAAFRYAIDLTQKQGGTTLAAPGWDPQSQAALQAGCDQAGVQLLRENLRAHAAALHTGLTMADWGIAETGTLVLDSTSEDLRLATMLVETHVAVLPRSRIQPDSPALKPELDKLMQAPPRYLAFISGASRTADIERVLTLGVHGPLELHLLILKDK